MKIDKFEQAIRKDDFSIGDSLGKLYSSTAKQQEADKMKYEEEKLIKPMVELDFLGHQENVFLILMNYQLAHF